MSEEQTQAEHRSRPTGAAFREFMTTGWRAGEDRVTPPSPVAPFAATRREQVSEAFAGERLVIPAGGLKVRSNDTDYVFRPHSAFAHLTGLGADREADAVLVLEPVQDEGGHDAVLYMRPPAGRDSAEFFADSRMGEYWIGSRPDLDDVASELTIMTKDLGELAGAVAKDLPSTRLRVVRDADREVTALIDQVRSHVVGEDLDKASRARAEHEAQDADTALARHLSTLRLVKDDWEIEQMVQATEATARAFDAVVDALPEAADSARGERWIEGVFGLHARHEGNGVGYDSICAAGDHATTLHWIRNTGEVNADELLLLDAGVETDALYTADVTRTLPVSGAFSPPQRRVYEAVLAAQDAGLAACKPGNRFSDVHAAAIRVIAETLFDWGLLPEGVGVEETLDAETGQFHRRWMVHGTSHHLGIDVHDCALAVREDYMEGVLREGMVITVEPGLYFKSDDELVPNELRGIGVRIEDDVLITAEGYRNLSAMLPRDADGVEAWIAAGGQR
ncbi:MAG: aminopeptidase P family protein [Ornithinimicrobium sp.]